MTTHIYDGTTNLQPAIAALCGCSVKSQATLASLIKQAKASLGITGKRKLPAHDNSAIYQWHYCRLNNVSFTKPDHEVQLDIESIAPLIACGVEIMQQAEPITLAIESMSDNQSEPTKTYRQLNKDGKPFRRNRPSKADNDNVMYGDYEQVRIAFYLGSYGNIKRQLLTLDGYYVNLLLSIGIDKKGVSTWIEQAIEQHGIDDTRPLTEQVKRMIIDMRIVPAPM